MIIVGVAAGFLGGVLMLGVVTAVGTSRWWHRRKHQDGLYIYSCDHCLQIWERT